MKEFVKAIFGKHILIVSESYGIFRLKGGFYAKLSGDQAGALAALKYFVAVHVVLLSIISLAGIASMGGGLTLVKSELYVLLALLLSIPHIVGFKVLGWFGQAKIPIAGVCEIVFYASAFVFVVLGTAGLATFLIALLARASLPATVLDQVSIWHWAIVIAFVYATVVYYKYQLAWLYMKYGMRKRPALLMMLLSQATVGGLAFKFGH